MGYFAVWVVLLLAYLGLVWQQLRFGIEYDEGSNLTVVRNFGEGRGYVSSGLLPWEWSRGFDPGASTGPALLVPGGVLWWISGGSLETTRLVPLAYFAGLVVALGLLFRRLSGPWAGLLAAASPLLLAVGKEDISTVSLVPGRYVGEIAATASLVVMALFLAHSRPLLAGLAGGLAIQSKVHFLLPVAVLAVVWFVAERSAGRIRGWRTGALVSMGVVLPTVAFELFRLISLGPSGYVVSIKEFAVWLVGQGAAADTEPFLASAGERLGGLLSVLSLGGAVLAAAALVAIVLVGLAGVVLSRSASGSGASESRALASVVALAAGGASIFAWWMFWPPEKLPRVGIPVLLIAGALVVVSAFVVLRGLTQQPAGAGRAWGRASSWVLGVGALLFVVSQGWIAVTNDFGGRMLEEQRASAQVIQDSSTPSLPMEWIWNLAQFQILSGVPSETKPGIGAPTVSVYDSIRARVDYGVDDARAFIPSCPEVLYSSQSSVVCSRDVEGP